MRLMLLGQSLVTHDLRKVAFPDRAAITSLLGQADAVFTDLEVALQGPWTPTREGQFLHTAPPAVLDCLRDLGVTLLGQANNHAWDLGTEGIVAARAMVLAGGFASAGTGSTIEEAFAPAYADTASGRVGLVCCAAGKIREGAAATMDRPGVAELRLTASGTPNADDQDRFLAAIAQAASRASAVIACLHNHHWLADPAQTSDWQNALARACIEAGAAVFVGHGTPQLQGIDQHRGRPILHGLGSFIFQSVTPPGHYTHAAWQGLIVELDTDTGALRLHPLVLNEAGPGPTRGIPSLAQGARAQSILRHVAELRDR